MFSYAEYRNIITLVKHNLPIMDFSEVSDEVDSFCVLRHDIEFSIDMRPKKSMFIDKLME